MSEEEITVKKELNGAVNDLDSAVEAKIDGGEWTDMLPDLKSANNRLEIIIATLEELEE